MPTRRRLRFVAAAGAALALGVGTTGCTDGDGGGDPRAPGTLRIAVAGDLVIDPVDASLASAGDLMVIDLLHDGLTELGDDGVAVARLAREWEANEELTAWRFRLDPEATFTGGRAITPQDVITSLERVMLAGDASLAALSLESVTGFREFVDGETPHVRGLSAPDAETVRIGLDSPLSVLPEVLASPSLSVVDAASIADGSLADLELSGDWSVAEVDGASLSVAPREGRDLQVEAVELQRHDDTDDAYDAFADGDADWAAIPAERFEDAIDEFGDDHLAPFHAELFFGMNLASDTLRNPIMRSAISQAIDREALVDAVYADLADPLGTVVPAGVVGHAAPADRCDACTYDPVAAKAIVSAAYPEGDAPVVRIDFDESDTQDEMARLIATDLEAAGIATELRPKPLEDYKQFVVSGEQELFSFGWIGAYSSPDGYLAPLFGSSANDNLTGYRSPQVDLLLQAARASTDRAKALEHWATAERRVLDDWVVVPIAQFRTQVVVSGDIEGFAHRVDGTVDWSAVRLAG